MCTPRLPFWKAEVERHPNNLICLHHLFVGERCLLHATTIPIICCVLNTTPLLTHNSFFNWIFVMNHGPLLSRSAGSNMAMHQTYPVLTNDQIQYDQFNIQPSIHLHFTSFFDASLYQIRELTLRQSNMAC